MTQQELITEPLDEPRDLAHAEPNDLTPLMLIQRAVEQGTDPAQLKALIDLQEQWRAARAKEAFAAAMTAVQAEMPCVVRDARNEQTKSTYVRLETITHRAKPILTANGFSLSFSEDQSDKADFKRIVCLVRHSQGHSERHWIDLPLDGKGAKGNPIGQMNPVQAAISTGSYGQRVLTCRIFNITVADTDLDGEVPNPPANPVAPRAQPRGQRTAAATDVDPQVVKDIKAHWQGQSGNITGEIDKDRQRFVDWVCQMAGRPFDPLKVSQWTKADAVACFGALGQPNPWEVQP